MQTCRDYILANHYFYVGLKPRLAEDSIGVTESALQFLADIVAGAEEQSEVLRSRIESSIAANFPGLLTYLQEQRQLLDLPVPDSYFQAVGVLELEALTSYLHLLTVSISQ